MWFSFFSFFEHDNSKQKRKKEKKKVAKVKTKQKNTDALQTQEFCQIQHVVTVKKMPNFFCDNHNGSI